MIVVCKAMSEDMKKKILKYKFYLTKDGRDTATVRKVLGKLLKIADKITYELLKETMIGKSVNSVRKQEIPDEDKATAKLLVRKWKDKFASKEKFAKNRKRKLPQQQNNQPRKRAKHNPPAESQGDKSRFKGVQKDKNGWRTSIFFQGKVQRLVGNKSERVAAKVHKVATLARERGGLTEELLDKLRKNWQHYIAKVKLDTSDLRPSAAKKRKVPAGTRRDSKPGLKFAKPKPRPKSEPPAKSKPKPTLWSASSKPKKRDVFRDNRVHKTRQSSIKLMAMPTSRPGKRKRQIIDDSNSSSDDLRPSARRENITETVKTKKKTTVTSTDMIINATSKDSGATQRSRRSNTMKEMMQKDITGQNMPSLVDMCVTQLARSTSKFVEGLGARKIPPYLLRSILGGCGHKQLAKIAKASPSREFRTDLEPIWKTICTTRLKYTNKPASHTWYKFYLSKQNNAARKLEALQEKMRLKKAQLARSGARGPTANVITNLAHGKRLRNMTKKRRRKPNPSGLQNMKDKFKRSQMQLRGNTSNTRTTKRF